MNKNESKYFNTAIKMDEALLLLLEKKDFAYVTIKEICETAGVNRSTFYLHYENTADLLKETTAYVLDKHFAYYDVDAQELSHRVAHIIETGDRRALIFITREYLIPYLTFIKENRRIFKTSLKQFKVMNMDAVYERMFKLVFEPILASFHVPEKDRPFVIKFYLTGVFAVIREWLDKDCAEEQDFIVRIINDCVLGARDIHG